MGLYDRVDLPKRICHCPVHARAEGRLRGGVVLAARVGANALCHSVQAIPCQAHTFRGPEIEV